MTAADSPEPLPSWIYRSEAFAEDLLDDDAAPSPAGPGPLQRAAAAARRSGRGLYGWLRRPVHRPQLAA